jgi:hypothetical protein
MVSSKIGSAGGHEILLRIDRDAVCSGNVCEGFNDPTVTKSENK